MLSKSDKEFIKDTIKEALTVKVQMERFNKDTGIKEIKIETVYLPEFLVDYFSHLEGALRGVQETTDHVKNRSNETKEAVKSMAQLFIGAEKNFMNLAGFIDYSKNKQIEKTLDQYWKSNKASEEI